MDARDAPPGVYHFEALCNVMRRSRKIIVVLSNSFLARAQCNAEAAFVGEKSFSCESMSRSVVIIVS